jgi:hypothetical protein
MGAGPPLHSKKIRFWGSHVCEISKYKLLFFAQKIPSSVEGHWHALITCRCCVIGIFILFFSNCALCWERHDPWKMLNNPLESFV